MTDIEKHQFVGIVCDSCGKTHELPEPIDRWAPGRLTFLEARWHEGWSRWSSRSIRDYCPTCKPRPGHKMRKIAGGES